SLVRQGAHLGDDQAAEQVLRGPRQGAPGLRRLPGWHPHPGRPADHAPGRVRRCHRGLRRAVARGRADRGSRHQGAAVIREWSQLWSPPAQERRIGARTSRRSRPMISRLLVAALLLWPATASAQTQKTMQIVVPFAPGASADGIARIVASELAARLGRQVVVENKPGAGGSLGLVAVAKAPPDGDTLGAGPAGALVINPPLQTGSTWDPPRDLAPVAKLIEIPLVLVTHPVTGPKSIAELIALAKARPDGVSYGSTGVNSSQHLAVEMLKQATGANLVHVPYRGSAPAVTDVLGGQIALASVDL